MKRRDFITLLGGATAIVWPHAVLSAQRPLVAILVGGSSTDASRWLDGFLQGMQELGYVEGRNVEIAYRYAGGYLERMPALANDLVQLSPQVFVTGNIAGTLAIKKATATIPIVNPTLVDPVGFGLVTSHARPGGQVTGILTTLDTLPGKQLQLALEVLPGATRIGMLVNSSSPSNVAHRRDAEALATALAIKLVPVEVRSPVDIDAAFQTLAQQRTEILFLPNDGMLLSERKRVAALAAAARLPAIYGFREHVEDGGLMSYGINLRENWRRAAAFVHEILKGAKPGDLPVEFPTRLELVINLKSAKALGLIIPPTLLTRADEVIE
jgi:putative ABC transport system substrate-binding protein